MTQDGMKRVVDRVYFTPAENAVMLEQAMMMKEAADAFQKSVGKDSQTVIEGWGQMHSVMQYITTILRSKTEGAMRSMFEENA